MAGAGELGLDRYDFEQHYIELPEGRIHYVDEGSGPVLLMVHGNPTWSYLYRHLIHGLKDRFRCVAVDHLGFGLSEKPATADYRIAAHTRRLGEVVEALGLDQVTPVVQDWGGPIGLGWAADNKDRVAGLVIMNTMAFTPRPQDMDLRTMLTLLVLKSCSLPGIGELLIRRMNGFVRWFMPYGIHHRDRKSARVMAGYRHPFPDYGSRRAILRMPREIPMTPLHRNFRLLNRLQKKLAGWDVPALIIWAQRDPAFPKGLADRFAALLPNHREILRIDDASHYLQEDTPAPIIAAIRDFIA